MSKSVADLLSHIADEIAFLMNESQSLSEERFMHDPVRQRAFARSLEIIGEAIKMVPDVIRLKYPDIDWKSYAGLRDKLIHHYFGVDYALVWDVVIHEMPELKSKLTELIEKLSHLPTSE